ncbi:MAG: PAS domain-containing protein, partial [Gammaproteobacteria bacterium]
MTGRDKSRPTMRHRQPHAPSDDNPPPARTEHSNEELLHELQAHKFKLEDQNEILRETQAILEASRDRYLDLYDIAPVGYLTLNAAGSIIEINLTAVALLGEHRNKLLNQRFVRFITNTDQDRWRRDFHHATLHGDSQRCEVQLQRPDGFRFHAQLDYLRLDKIGDQPVVRMALLDITERKRAEEELRIAAIAFETREGLMVTDANGTILRVNRAFTRMTGFRAAEVMGQTPALLRSGRHDPTFYQRMWQSLLQYKHSFNCFSLIFKAGLNLTDFSPQGNIINPASHAFLINSFLISIFAKSKAQNKPRPLGLLTLSENSVVKSFSFFNNLVPIFFTLLSIFSSSMISRYFVALTISTRFPPQV